MILRRFNDSTGWCRVEMCRVDMAHPIHSTLPQSQSQLNHDNEEKFNSIWQVLFVLIFYIAMYRWIYVIPLTILLNTRFMFSPPPPHTTPIRLYTQKLNANKIEQEVSDFFPILFISASFKWIFKNIFCSIYVWMSKWMEYSAPCTRSRLVQIVNKERAKT